MCSALLWAYLIIARQALSISPPLTTAGGSGIINAEGRCNKRSALYVKVYNQIKTETVTGQGGGFCFYGKKERRAALLFGGIMVDYFTTLSQKRMRMVAVWARTALPLGLSVVSVTPVIRPTALAQDRASSA